MRFIIANGVRWCLRNLVDSGAHARPPAMMLAILAALVPLAFAPPLFDPFLETKELLLVTGAAAAAALWLIAGRALEIPRTPVWLAIGAIAIAATLSNARGPAAVHFAALLVLLAVAASEMHEPAARAALAGAVTVAGVVEALYVLSQSLGWDPLFSNVRLAGKWRGFGTLGNPNWAGEFLAVALLIGWGRFIARGETGRWRKPFDIFCLVVIAAGLAATFARGAWLACTVGAAGFWLSRRGGWRQVSGVVAAALAVFGTVLATLVVLRPDTLRHLANVASLRGRVWMWIVAVSAIRDSPWRGFGIGGFGATFPRYQAEAFTRPWAAPFLTNGSFTPHAHNDFLQLWVEAGVVAALGFAALGWMVMRRGRRLAEDPIASGCWAALVCLLVNSAYASPLYMPASAALIAMLIGTVEASACPNGFWKLRPRRWLACLLALAACGAAWPYCWQRARFDLAVQRASAALGRGNLPEADTALRAALHLNPEHSEAWALAGRLRFERSEYEASAEAFGRALRLAYDADTSEARAGALWKAGHRDEALAALEELVRLRPDLPWARRELRLLRAASGQAEGR